MTKIKWYRSHEGFKESKCGRFEISPKFMSSTTPQAYELIDNKTKKILYRHLDSQKEAMEEAEEVIEKEEKEE